MIFISSIMLWLLVNIQTGFVMDSFNGSRRDSEQTSGCYVKAVGYFSMHYIARNFPLTQPHCKDTTKLNKSKNYFQVRHAWK